MRKWGLDQGLEEDKTIGSLHNFKKVKLIPDGACLFTRGMGMNCSWTTERGFGKIMEIFSCYKQYENRKNICRATIQK